MPVYEYSCETCGRATSLFFRSIASVEASPSCPLCGERTLVRRISRVWTRRSSSPGDDAFPDYDFEHDGVPFYGGNPSMLAEAGLDSVAESVGDDDDDISAFARETRVMSEMMGQPIDAEFDSALRHIEQGADPDDVFGEMDALAENSAVDDDV